jgi:hypothetical protein
MTLNVWICSVQALVAASIWCLDATHFALVLLHRFSADGIVSSDSSAWLLHTCGEGCMSGGQCIVTGDAQAPTCVYDVVCTRSVFA